MTTLTDKQIQQKLDQLTKLVNELDAEAKRRYGEDGSLFYEADGSFHLMDGDSSGTGQERIQHVRFSSGHCLMDCGAW